MANNEFGVLLKQLREKAGLSQEELGKKIGVGASTIGHLECGRRLPSIEVAIRLSREFSVSLDTLLGKVPA